MQCMYIRIWCIYLCICMFKCIYIWCIYRLLSCEEICQILMDLKIQPKSLSEQEAMAQLIEVWRL